MEAKFEKATTLKKIIEAIKGCVGLVIFNCSASGISVQELDPTHISLVSLLLHADGFEKYRCDRNLALGIHLEALSKVLKTAQYDDSVTIISDNPDTLRFIFESKNRISDFQLILLDFDIDMVDPVPADSKSILTMPAPEFQRICLNLSTWGDYAVISTSKDGAKFSVDGDTGRGHVFVKPTEDGRTRIFFEEEAPVTQTLSLEKLRAFTRATPLSAFVTISMAVDVPFEIEYTIAAQRGYLRFYLAPRIEDDEV